MREKVNKFDREYRGDRTNMFEESPNAFKTIGITDIISTGLVDGEPVVDADNDRILINSKGSLKKLAVINGEIKLEDI